MWVGTCVRNGMYTHTHTHTRTHTHTHTRTHTTCLGGHCEVNRALQAYRRSEIYI